MFINILLLPAGQKGENWNLPKSNVPSEMEKHLMEKDLISEGLMELFQGRYKWRELVMTMFIFW
jgi:hypothetical protein